MCPYGARALTGKGGWTETATLVTHVLAIESNDGIVLVDTGIGTADIADPGRAGPLFQHVIRPSFDLAETALEQLGALGFAPSDVRHILITHLDSDHAGGLGDFPNAQVHIFRTEMDAALNPSLRERPRYASAQWAHGPAWHPYDTGGDNWFGFESVRAIEGLDTEIAIVPLVGHSRGHSAIAVRRGAAEGNDWLLHCGDSHYSHLELETPPAIPWGLAAFERLSEFDRSARLGNLERLRELDAKHSDQVTMFCAHDPADLERLGGVA